MTPIKIGIVGYSRNSFDQPDARQKLRSHLEALKAKHGDRPIEVVTGYTAQGVPLIAYELADELGMITVGFSARRALRAKAGVYPCQKEILVGENYGDESEAFIEYIDGLIRIGGGKQSLHEVELFKTKHAGRPLERLLVEEEVESF